MNWEEAAQILRQHRPDRTLGIDERARAIRCSCGAAYRPSKDYYQAIADHQAAEIVQALGQNVPLTLTR